MNAIVLSQNSFGLAPKIFNAVDMVFAFGKVCRMIDAMMAKAADIKCIVRPVGIGVDHAVRLDFAGNNGHQGAGLGIVDHRCVNLAMTLENAKDNHFSCGSSSTFAFANTTKIAFIQFNIAIKHLGTLIPRNDLPNFLIEKNRCIGLDSKQVSSRTGGDFQYKKFQQLLLSIFT